MLESFKAIDPKRDFAVLLGRMSPITLGHAAVIDSMRDEFGGNCCVLIGSCNEAISYRHFFSYADRAQFIRTVYPDLRISGMPDYTESDDTWMQHLDDLLAFGGVDATRAVFYSGSKGDVEFFINAGRRTKIMNRYDGTTPKVSGSEVRDALIEHRSIADLVRPELVAPIEECFRRRWEFFKTR